MTGGVGALGKRSARRRAWLPEWCRLLYLDYRRHRVVGRGVLETMVLTQGMWACFVYRVCHALVDTMPSGPLQWAAKAFAAVPQKLMEILTGICLPRDAEIGGG